ncbi:hypothetical protein LINPERHAP1_LOCUS26684, partial [Linum perenne]
MMLCLCFTEFVYREILASERWRSSKHRIGLTGQSYVGAAPAKLRIC